MELSNALERFNRKERNLAVRHILGCTARPPPLHPDFCRDVGNKLGLDKSKLANAWWWTDYHISWLAGALALYTRGDGAEGRTWPNQPVKFCSRRSATDKQPVERHIAEGNQEDIDLLIVVENHLIMIEVKAYGHWDSIQLESKLTRLRLVRSFYEGELQNEGNVRFYFLLLSPDCLKEERWKEVKQFYWDDHDTNVPWIKLDLPLCSKQILEVGRCDVMGRRQEIDHNHWGVYKLNAKRL